MFTLLLEAALLIDDGKREAEKSFHLYPKSDL